MPPPGVRIIPTGSVCTSAFFDTGELNIAEFASEPPMTSSNLCDVRTRVTSISGRSFRSHLILLYNRYIVSDSIASTTDNPRNQPQYKPNRTSFHIWQGLSL